jgi:uncharacterized protein with HEPN domain
LSDRNRPRDAETALDRRTVQDLLEFCNQAARLVARGRKAYDADELLRLAGEAITHRVGEASGRLSQPFRNQHPDVPWRAIRGMRNVVAHDYGRIDHRIVWMTLQHDLPRLADALQNRSRPSGLGPASPPLPDDPG